MQVHRGAGIAFMLTACAVLSSPAQADEFSGQRWAVLIGVDDYAQATDLNYCGADMVALREQLIAVGFPEKQIKLLYDKAEENRFWPIKGNIERQLNLVLSLAGRGDMIVVALSGHGVHFGGTSYFCPAEADLQNPSTLVSLDNIYDQLKQSQASLKLVIVDACRNDPRVPGQKSLSNPAKEFARALQKPLPQGMILLSSCAPGETSYEEPTFGHGVFMHHLLEGLKGKADSNQNKRVSIKELATYVNHGTKVYVADRYNDFQRPYLRGDLTLEALDFQFPSATVAATTNRITEPRVTEPRVTEPRPTTTPTTTPPSSEMPKSITNSIGMKLNLIPAGEFMMGSGISAEELELRFKVIPSLARRISQEHPQHRVRITKQFYMGVHEVTVGEFRRFVDATGHKTDAETNGKGGSGWDLELHKSAKKDPKYNWRNAGFSQSESHPVVNVTWKDAMVFCRWLSRKEGIEYRLPTEAEWEYACRAGTRTLYYHGDSVDGLVDVANFHDTSFRAKSTPLNDGFVFTAPVGQFQPNQFGLYDMHGNVFEWCSDWFDEEYYTKSPVDNPAGPPTGTNRVIRGGSWMFLSIFQRSSFRFLGVPWDPYHGIGFRVVRVVE